MKKILQNIIKTLSKMNINIFTINNYYFNNNK